MKAFLKKSLFKAGIDIRRSGRSAIVDFTNEDVDPLGAYYKSGPNSFFARVPLEHCRHIEMMAFKCDAKCRSPYVQTLLEYADGSCVTYSSSWLEKVYERFQPQSAADRMGIENPSCQHLAAAPPCGAFLPWSRFSPWEESAKWRAMNARENKENGLHLGYEGGDKLFGPTSREKGELEFRRLVNAYESIKQHGYRKNHQGLNNISGVMLVGGDRSEPRFYCAKGHHRLAAITALGHPFVDVEINKNICGGIFRREEASFWPPVQAGYLTYEEALALFDRMFDGEPPITFTRAMGMVTNTGDQLDSLRFA